METWSDESEAFRQWVLYATRHFEQNERLELTRASDE